jgi:hypothetical protein
MSERAIYVGTFGARRMAWDTQTGKDGSFAVHIPSDAQGAVNFVGLAGYCQEIVVPQGIPSLRVEEQGIRFRRVPPGVYEGIEVRFSLMGVADVRVAGPAGKAAGEVALVVHPTERIYRAARPGKFRIEIPPNQDARIEVRDKSGKQSLLTTEPFRVKEGELIEKHLVLPKR